MMKIIKNNLGFFEINAGLNSKLKMGISAREYSTKFGDVSHEGDISRDHKLVEQITGIENRNISFLDQVHGDDIIVVDSFPREESVVMGAADGIITPLVGIVLVIRTADCVPVIIVDEKKGIIAAVHSGWKSTEKNITGKCINKMNEDFSSSPGDLKLFILPSIGPMQYEVNRDVADFFPDDTLERDGKLFVDLWSNIERSALKEGVSNNNIYNAHICNRTEHESFFSHRYGDKGRNLNFVYMTDSLK